MKLVKIERNGACAEGIVDGADIRIIGGWTHAPSDRARFSLGAKSRGELKALLAMATETVPLSGTTLAVPMDPLAQLFCVGFNYRANLTETGSDEPKEPVIFKRTLDTLVAHGQAIVRPRASETLDYEGEIAIVIGKAGRYITEEDAFSHVGGYSCFMDGSIREYQKHGLTAGKNFWRTGSLGPWIVTPDEVGSDTLSLETFVDGEQRQSATSRHMIFNIPRVIAYCSTMTLLQPGDIITTGTPGGAGWRMTPPSWLRPGQTVEVDVGGVGRLRNLVKDES